MIRVKNRAVSALILVIIMILGIALYTVKFVLNGDGWVSAAFNMSTFEGGRFTDRNGAILAGIDGGKRIYSDNADTRRATLHTVGDAAGFIGTGMLTLFTSELIGYNPLTGVYSRASEGETVELTIDAKLTVEAYKALDGRRGTVIVFNYETGEIICMTSSPTFDPMNPPESVNNDPKYEGVYINRAISATYTPGSIFKLLTAAAAIENIKDVFERVFICTGSLETGQGIVTCNDVHGKIDFSQALAVSCNCAFGELSLELGADILAKYAENYGLTERASISGIMTAKGSFDKAEDDTADLAWSGIGQYNDSVCPAVMLRFVGAIANGGVAVNMSLLSKGVLSSIRPPGGTRIMKEETARRLSEMMDYENRSAGIRNGFPGLEIHAKTGTAEVGGGNKPHAWFTGFITNEECPLAFVVVVENGGTGLSAAGPVANKVLQAAVQRFY